MRKPRFALNTGRNRDQWHTMMRTGKSARLGSHLAEPYVEINPADATALGATHGALIEVENTHGRSLLRALITTKVAQGQLFAPMHWTRQRTTCGTVNSVTAPLTDPISGQPALKGAAVDARVYDAKWFGFLACLNEPTPQTPYAAIARTGTGWQVELASKQTPMDWEAEARTLSGETNGEVAVQADLASGATRIVITQGGQITALFFASPKPVVLARSAIIQLIGTDTLPLVALAGRAPANLPDAGVTVCACLSVGRNTLIDAISNGANSVAALGIATCAGTNCGSCKPELAALLAQRQLPLAAE
jgi:assimilatory nitrate reductase catalytic subunit